MEYRYSQFVFARELRGLSQTRLAKEIKGLSQSNLSKFEKGLDILSEDKVDEIIKFLDFPKEFFKKRISNSVEIAHYRKKAGVSKAIKTELESNNKILGYLVDCLSESVDFEDYKLRPLDPEFYTPEEVARYTRKSMGVYPEEPITDIFRLLEVSGIVVIELDEVPESFDGVSFKTDKGTPVIIINKKFPNDRKRFTLAHELGHILMHNSNDIPTPEYRTDAIKENEANRFASEFLMPEKEIKNSLFDLKLSSLSLLKRRWKTSKASIIMRAKDLKCIDTKRYKYLMIEMSRTGQRKVEDTLVDIDKPFLFEQAYKMYVGRLKYSKEDLSQAFSLPIDLLDKFFNFENKPKLRLIRN